MSYSASGFYSLFLILNLSLHEANMTMDNSSPLFSEGYIEVLLSEKAARIQEKEEVNASQETSPVVAILPKEKAISLPSKRTQTTPEVKKEATKVVNENVKVKEKSSKPYCFGNQKILSKKIYSQMGLSVPSFKKGKAVKIAIIDTGIDLKNPLLSNAIIPTDNLKNYDFYRKRDLQDYNGHGTHVAGIILGIYPKAKILPLKWGELGDYDVRNEVAALKYAIEQDVDIINLSIQGREYSKQERLLLKKAEEKGILVIVAAGNDRSELTERFHSYPASLKESNMIVVGAHDSSMNRVFSSNYSRTVVDTFALGHEVVSLNLKSNKSCFTKMTGTSMAAPMVTGFAAILKHNNPELSNTQIKEIILSLNTPSKELENYATYGHLEPYRIINYRPSVATK